MDHTPNLGGGCTPAVDLGPYTGVVLLGTFISLALWGIATMQFILFFTRKHPGDSWRLKSLVVFVWTMDTIHKCLLMAGNYIDIVSGEAINLRAPNRILIATQLLMCLVATPVHLFFVYRIWRFENRVRWLIIVPLSPCMLFQFVLGFVLPTINWIRANNPNAIPRSTMLALVVANMSVVAAVDILLAVGLCTLLWRTYLDVVSGAAGSQSPGIWMMQRIALLTINTGIWTALFNVLTVATSIKYPDKQIHYAFCFIIAPVYVNMLLTNLNARSFIRQGANKVIEFNHSGASDMFSSVRIRSVRMPSATISKDRRNRATLTGSRNPAGDGTGNSPVIIEKHGDLYPPPMNGKVSPV